MIVLIVISILQTKLNIYCNVIFLYPWNILFVLLLVCIDVKFIGIDNTLSWRIGHCSSREYKDSLSREIINTYRCCLAPGEHILTCEASGQFHWRQSYVLIQGRKYCNDFIGFKALRRITIFRKKKFYVLSNNRHKD